MPYILKEDRSKYVHLIEKTIGLICEEKGFLRIEQFGFFVKSMIDAFSSICVFAKRYDCGSYESDLDTLFITIDPSNKDHLNDLALELGKLLPRDDLLKASGDLNYNISAIAWGLLGDSLNAGSSAKYGIRAYLKGVLTRLIDNIDKTQSNRTSVMIEAVLTDVVDEMYRRKTSIYEDAKIAENGDVWPLRNWAVSEQVPIELIQDVDYNDLPDYGV